MIRAKANISTGVKFGSSLAYKNHAANNLLAAELFDAETPTGRIAAVARGTACLFVSHNLRSETFRG
jgi:phage FluMu protein gp41